ncbi:hypothetical protein ISS04_01025 [Candidatus Woesearchaeota archaeon]|nr:hypothetical protein [Candidatus Woesearchaeota archaeon]
MNNLRAVGMCILFVLFSISVYAIPQSITVNGLLTNSNNDSLTGTYEINFTIYDNFTGGNVEYNTIKNVTTDANGVYNVVLSGLDIDFSEDYYLGVQVESDAEMTPRLNLTSSPYAFTTSGLEPEINLTHNVSIDSGTLFIDASSDRVGIGTGSPSVKLEVNGTINASQVLVNGSAVLTSGDESNLNVNYSTTSNTTTWWNSVSNWISGWFYQSGNYLAFNESRLNATIDARADGYEADTQKGTSGNYVYNDSTNIMFNETELNTTIDARDNYEADTQKGTSGNYVYNDSTDIMFNETELNDTIDARADGYEADTVWDITGYVINDSGSLNVNESMLNATIEDLDTDTIYSHLSNFTDDINAINLWTNSSGNATFTGGNVGIGTTSPAALLSVGGNGESASLSVTGQPGVTNIATYRDSDGENVFKAEGNISGASLKVWFGDMDGVGNENYLLVDEGNSKFIFNNGNVGIGTTSPSQKLVVAGDLNVTGTSYLGNVVINSENITTDNIISKDGNISFFNSTGNEKMRITNEGNVGIGTTGPEMQLHVLGDGSTATGAKFIIESFQVGGEWMRFSSGSQGSSIKFSDTSQGLWIGAVGTKSDGSVIDDFFIGSDGKIGIGTYTPGTAGVAIMNGNVGIGTTNPSVKLEVNGTINASQVLVNGSAVLTSYTDTNTWWELNTGYLYNNSNNLDFNETMLNATIDARDNYEADTQKGTSGTYVYNDSTNIMFNETELNDTIDARADGYEADTHVAGDGVYLTNDSTTIYFNETMLNATIEDLDTDTTYSHLSNFTDDINAINLWTNSSGNITFTGGNVGIGTTSPGAKLDIVSTNYPVLQTKRTTSITGGGTPGSWDSNLASGYVLTTETSGDMTDGFGGGFLFYLADNTANGISGNAQARIYAQRDGADDIASIGFWTQTMDLGDDAKMIIRGNGNVGIGTISPSVKLQVNGTINASQVLVNGSAVLTSYTDTNTWWELNTGYLYNNSNNLDFNETMLNATIDARGNYEADTQKGTSGTYVYNDSTNIMFNETELNDTIDARDDDTTYTNNSFDLSQIPNTGNINLGAHNFSVDSDVLFVNANNNRVGIGTNNPSYPLEVNVGGLKFLVQGGDTRIYNQLYVTNIDSFSGGDLTLDGYGNYDVILEGEGNGKVGIGTSSPSVKLQVNGSLRLGDTGEEGATRTLSSGGSLVIHANMEGTDGMYNDLSLKAGNAVSAGLIVFHTNNNEQMRINGIGNVGIGTTTPLSTLHINGTLGALTGGLSFGDGDTGFYEDSDDQLRVAVNNIESWQIKESEIQSSENSGIMLLKEGANSTFPTLIPSGGDSNTGVGGDNSDQLSLIAGGKGLTVNNISSGIQTNTTEGNVTITSSGGSVIIKLG